MNRGLPPLSPVQDTQKEPIPILICLPYWTGDVEMCRGMAKLMADLQPVHAGNSCAVMICARQDCAIDGYIAEVLKHKFNVLNFVTSSPLRGWPEGPNGMFGSTMIHIYTSRFNIQTAYWMEADCVPTRPSWFSELHDAWVRRAPGANIVGCRHDCHGDGSGDHITGCAMYDPNIASILPKITTSSQWAWDYEHRADIVQMGQHTNLIYNAYKARNVAPTILEYGAAIIHGVKDYSLQRIVREKCQL